jgi:hypothetical protein
MGMLALVGTRNLDGLDARESGGPACPVLGAQYIW